MLISFVLGSRHKHSFQWNMGFEIKAFRFVGREDQTKMKLSGSTVELHNLGYVSQCVMIADKDFFFFFFFSISFI